MTKLFSKIKNAFTTFAKSLFRTKKSKPNEIKPTDSLDKSNNDQLDNIIPASCEPITKACSPTPVENDNAGDKEALISHNESNVVNAPVATNEKNNIVLFTELHVAKILEPPVKNRRKRYGPLKPFISLNLKEVTKTQLMKIPNDILKNAKNRRVSFARVHEFYKAILILFSRNHFNLFSVASLLYAENKFAGLQKCKYLDNSATQEAMQVIAFSFRAYECLNSLRKPTKNHIQQARMILEANFIFWILLKFEGSFPRYFDFKSFAANLIPFTCAFLNSIKEASDNSSIATDFETAHVSLTDLCQILEFALSTLQVFEMYPTKFFHAIAKEVHYPGFQIENWLHEIKQSSVKEYNFEKLYAKFEALRNCELKPELNSSRSLPFAYYRKYGFVNDRHRIKH